jgi:hypothetical protein
MLEPISQHLERSRLSEEFLRVFPYDPGVEIKQKGAGGRDDGELIVDLPLDDIVIDVRFPEIFVNLLEAPMLPDSIQTSPVCLSILKRLGAATPSIVRSSKRGPQRLDLMVEE